MNAVFINSLKLFVFTKGLTANNLCEQYSIIELFAMPSSFCIILVVIPFFQTFLYSLLEIPIEAILDAT